MLCVAAWVWFCLSTEFVELDEGVAKSDARLWKQKGIALG